MATITSHRDHIKDLDDWKLILIFSHFSYKVRNLTNPEINNCYRKIWSHTDAYGEKGYIPPQGYDWSGIRDSSQNAKQNMAISLREYLKSISVDSVLYNYVSL